MHHLEDLRESLNHVLWIGGAPDSGKTSVATLLAERHGLLTYHFDRHEMNHFSRADPAQHPALWTAHPDRMDAEQRWLGSTPREMTDATIASWSERCWMALDDIAELSAGSPIIAEGPGFFPWLLAPILTDSRKAIWLIPSEDFKRRSAAVRGKPGNSHETSDPRRASANIIARDLIMGRRIQESCSAHELKCLVVAGDEDVQGIAGRIEKWCRPWLARPEPG